MTKLQPLDWTYAVGFGDAPKQVPAEARDCRQITVHWVAAGRVTHTTREAWADVRPIIADRITVIMKRGEIWWDSNGKIYTQPPRSVTKGDPT